MSTPSNQTGGSQPPVPPRFNRPEDVATVLSRTYSKSIQNLLAEKYNITADEFIVSALQAIRKTPKLVQCNPASLLGSILTCAELGLKFNTPDGHAYILPYKNEAQFIMGYKGFVELLYRNPRVRKVYGDIVFEADRFEYEAGLEQKLVHVPALNVPRKDKGPIICAYAIIKLADAEPIVSVVDRLTLEEIEALSPSKGSTMSPYNNGTDVHNFMQIKAAIKKAVKTVPKGGVPEIAKAIELDDLVHVGQKWKLRDGSLPELTGGSNADKMNEVFPEELFNQDLAYENGKQ